MFFDADVNVYSEISKLKAQGVTHVGRYISPATSEEKVIKPGEAHALADAGIKLFLIYEQWGRPSGTAQGRRDGAFALKWAKLVGAPQGAAIYYTVDYDAGPGDLPGIVEAFTGFKAALGGYFKIGAYASGYICNELKARGLIDYRWLTMSGGFRGTHEAIASGAYELRQLLDKTVCGMDVDPDVARVNDFGAFLPFAVAVVAPASMPAMIVVKKSTPVFVPPPKPTVMGWLRGLFH